MNLIITGCEYAGKTTLVKRVAEWKERVLGTSVPIVWHGTHRMPLYHDHFSFPELGTHGDLTDEEAAAMWSLSPRLRKFFLTWGMYYHLTQIFFDDHDHILVGFHLEESVYAPLYYGYGEPGTRPSLSRTLDQEIMKRDPNTVLVLMKASPEVIAQRMKADPHMHGLLQEKDIEHVLERFDREFLESTIRYKFAIDTTDNDEEATFQEFVSKMYPHLTSADRLRMQTKLPPPESE